jgi:hypothetical protein
MNSVDAVFPAAGQSDKAMENQARELLTVMAITGFTRENTMRVCLKMRVMARELTDEQFDALRMGTHLKRDIP